MHCIYKTENRLCVYVYKKRRIKTPNDFKSGDMTVSL